MEIDTTPKGDYLNPIDKDLVDAFEQGKNYMKEYIQSNPSEFGLVKKEDYDHEKEQHAVWADAATNAMDTVEQLQHQADQLAEALREIPFALTECPVHKWP